MNRHFRGIAGIIRSARSAPRCAASGHPVLAVSAAFYGGGRSRLSGQPWRRPSMNGGRWGLRLRPCSGRIEFVR